MFVPTSILCICAHTNNFNNIYKSINRYKYAIKKKKELKKYSNNT